MTRAFAIGTMLAALVALPTNEAHAISCDNAASLNNAEKMVCQSDTLLAKDKQLNALFQRLAKKTFTMPEMMRKRQRDWVTARDECTEAACVERLYEERIRHLQLVEGRYTESSKKFGTTAVMLARGEWQVHSFVLRNGKPASLGTNERVWKSDLNQPLPAMSSRVAFNYDDAGAQICWPLAAAANAECAMLGSTRFLIENRIEYDEMRAFATLPRTYAADFKNLPASDVGTFFVNGKPWFSAIPVHDRTVYIPARACEKARPQRCIEGYQIWRAAGESAMVVGLP